jgi:Pectin methylesterase
VDFIFGGADALFDKCTIKSINPGFVAAPSGRKENVGFVFNECSFISDGLDDGSVYLMRPWREEGKSTFIASRFASHISKKGFSPWPGRAEEKGKAFFGLYDNPYFSEPENAVFLDSHEKEEMLGFFAMAEEFY